MEIAQASCELHQQKGRGTKGFHGQKEEDMVGANQR